jgi:phytol kinase
MKRTLLFLVLWLAIGFSIGTATLLGPVRWVTTLCRARGLPDSVEKAAVQLLIVLLVVVTGAAAWVLTRAALSSDRIETRYGLPALALAAAGGAVWLWMTPAMLRAQSAGVTTAGTHFTFGPYPDEDRLHDLAGERYTAVISLLHPAVIPFEPQLMAREDEAAARAGIQVIHLPMLPWVSDNAAVLGKVRDMARARTGHYYVHCYLGMDRVQMVRRVIEEEGGGVVETEALSEAPPLSHSQLWTRGEIVHLDDRVHLTPFPEADEFLRYFMGGRVQIVSLLDKADPDDRPWIEQERALVDRYRLPYISLPLSGSHFNPQAVLAAVRQVRALEGTIAVHDFLSPGSGRSPVAEAFAQAYRSGRPPLPPTLFVQPLERGAARVIAPHVATGPRPEPAEFGVILSRRGVRHVFCVGDPRSPAARVDRSAAAEAGLIWEALDHPTPAAVTGRMEKGGPFYLYGEVPSDLTLAITDRFGPAMPPRVTADALGMLAATAPRGGAQAAGRPAAHPAAAPIPAPGPTAGPAVSVIASAVSPVLPPPAPQAASPSALPSMPTRQPEPAGSRSFLPGVIPDSEMIVFLGPFLLLFTGGAAWVAGWMRTARGLPVAYSRKGFHFLIFTMAGVLQVMGGLPAVMLFGGLVSLIVLYAVARGEGFPFYEALARPDDAPRRTLFVLVPLITTAVGGLLANLLFGATAIVGYLVGGWGDAVGEPVGRAIGRHRYRVPSFGGVPATRSLEGSAAVLIAGSLAAITGLLLRGVPVAAACGIGAACGLAGALVEAFSTHGMDNLTVQLAAAGAAFLLLS